MKLRRLLVRIVAGVVATWFLTTVWLVGQREYRQSTGNAMLTAVTEDIASSDPDWTWDRLNAARARPPEGKNGAELVRQVREQWPQEWIRNFEPEPWEPIAPDVAPNVRYPALVVAEARAKLTRAGTAVQLARGLKDRPSGHREFALKPDVLSTLMPDTAHTRMVGRLLHWDTVLAAEDSDPRLVNDLLALLNTSGSIGDEPFLISQVIRVSARSIAIRSTERALAQAPIASTDLAPLQSAWATDAEEPLLLYGLRGDRAAIDVLFRNLARGTAHLDEPNRPRADRPLFDQYAEWLDRGRVPRDHAYYLRWMAQAVAAARLPAHEQLRAIDSLPPLPEGDPSVRYSLLLLPAAEKVARSTIRSTAEARCAVAGLACERFRQARGRWPAALADLVPEFLPAVPLDPFAGKPLGYAKPAGGAIVFSVGQSGAADAGELDGPELPGSNRCRFRLWDLDQRRLPPPELPAPPTPEQGP